jgi:hypothetical protein
MRPVPRWPLSSPVTCPTQNTYSPTSVVQSAAMRPGELPKILWWGDGCPASLDRDDDYIRRIPPRGGGGGPLAVAARVAASVGHLLAVHNGRCWNVCYAGGGGVYGSRKASWRERRFSLLCSVGLRCDQLITIHFSSTVCFNNLMQIKCLKSSSSICTFGHCAHCTTSLWTMYYG